MEQTEKKMDFRVLTEKISPENVLAMSELLAIKETKTLIGFMGYHAEKAHKRLCYDVFHKDISGYVLSDSYDLIQSVALFLCGHYGEYLDDFLYVSGKGKRITIKTECYRIMARMLCGTYRAMRKLESLENKIIKTEYEPEDEGEQDYTQADQIVAALCLTENMDKALNYRMSGMSYPEIGRMLSRATSTVYEYFVKMRQRYTALYGE